METTTLALLAGGGALIGFLLSVLGAGGSILLLPLLVSGAALPSREAVPLSLLVVCVLGLANLGPVLRRGQFAPGPALVLGLPALGGSWLGGSWVKAGLVSEEAQLGVFALAAITASWLLSVGGARRPGSLRAAEPRPYPTKTGETRCPPLALAAQGVVVGLLTGIAGVGGGFAIVPALVLLAGLPMPLATGTSLFLIVVNALVALTALGHWPGASLPLLSPLLAGGALGALAGQRLSPLLNDRRLRQSFSLLLVGSALLTGSEAWRHHQSPHPAASTPMAPAAQRAQTRPQAGVTPG